MSDMKTHTNKNQQKQNSCFLIYNTLRTPTTKRWAKLTGIVQSSAALISVFFSIAGYLTFGNVEC